MGILNRTPDSFYDNGATFELDKLYARAEQLVAEGADILDVGGVKAGPGPEVTEAEELDRVVPVVAGLVARFETPVSVDTWRASVARASYAEGAVMGNDISGLADPDYAAAAAEHGAAVVATHIRLAPRVADPDPHYDDVVHDVVRFLIERAARAAWCRHPRRAHRPRRRTRPRQDGGAVADPAARPRPPWPGSATRSCSPRPTRRSSARSSIWSSPSAARLPSARRHSASPGAAASCGCTTSRARAGCATRLAAVSEAE